MPGSREITPLPNREADPREELKKLVIGEPKDPVEVLKTIVDAISNRPIEESKVRAAVETTFHKYENQLRLFLIGFAKTRINRILKLMSLLDQVEERLFDPGRMQGASTRELITMYATLQTHMNESIDFVKRIVEMRAELERKGVRLDMKGSLETVEDEFKDLPQLTAPQRERVRRILNSIVIDVNEAEEPSSADKDDAGTTPGRISKFRPENPKG